MTVLADSSIWVDYRRLGSKGPADKLDQLLASRQVVVCGPVVAELLGTARQDGRSALERVLEDLDWVPIGREEWLRVGQIAHLLRSRGNMVPLPDVMIAVAAMAAEAEIWTRDRHFREIANVAPELRFFVP